MSYNFEGKVATVSGGASSIGAEMVKLLVEGGAAVVIADIDLGKATAFAEELKQKGGKAAPFKANVPIPMMQKRPSILPKRRSADCILRSIMPESSVRKSTLTSLRQKSGFR